MADKAISELVRASIITAADLFVLQQDNTAKCLPGQVLLNWLTAAADGHGGIADWKKIGTSGLVDTYRVTLADTTTFDYYVTNGKAISSVKQTSVSGLTRTYTIAFNDETTQQFTVTDGKAISSVKQTAVSGLTRTYTISFNDGTTQPFEITDGRSFVRMEKTETNGLVDTYTIFCNDGSTETLTVTNGEKGDKGDRADIWVRYASQKPTESSHNFGELPDTWIGIATGHNMDAAPTDWKAYDWFQWKGEKGDTGEPAERLSVTTAYQVGDAGNIIPSGSWLSSIPYVAPGKYLWIRKTTVWNKGDPDVDYSVSRMGIDGTGAVATVAGVGPDANGNVPLTAADVKALPIGGGIMEGPINMNGQPISGLNEPTANDQAANMGFVNRQVRAAAHRNLLDNSDFRNPVNQRGYERWTPEAKPETGADANTCYGFTGGYTIDRWLAYRSRLTVNVSDGYLELVNTTSETVNLVQELENKVSVDKSITIAVKFKDGGTYSNKGTVAASGSTAIMYLDDCTIYYAGGSGWMTIGVSAGSSIKLEWVALYEGEYTAETLQEYQPKGYGVELLECKRYFQKYQGIGFTVRNNGQVSYMLPVEMRTTPTFSYGKKSIYTDSSTDVSGNYPDWEPTLYPSIIAMANNVYNGYATLQFSDIELNADL